MLLITSGLFCVALAILQRDLYPLVTWGLMLGALGIFSAVALIVNASFVFPLTLLLLGKIFERGKK